ncbi:alpha/beta hydrolase [Oceanicoccus sagamiensis]|uniref:Alpha/beta hydrolase fold-3 domain-containing protein n=1 Tax=Oceanicoccus sagamiensis TaxID=716816 RepID=A0A1X9N6R6_9GAMM|nr:alpha/beta hydrolase fold domain-containing protein [Oceanicoccus sagamiensis]ARN73788.1 hypothetical protein BST96_06475 [Oceanicoccus sagamiensis]
MTKPADTHTSIKVPAFRLEDSALLSAESRQAIKCYRDYLCQQISAATTVPSDPAAVRHQAQQRFVQGPVYASLIARYAATSTTETLAGVNCEVFLPTAGISPANTNRVLINLHGGSFENGTHTNGVLESLPVAALGKIKVISIDYRKAPEHRFPAATDDVEAVYSALLADYKPQQIGIYGASAGAELTAQTLVRLQQRKLPLPMAIGLLASGATRFDLGDSVTIGDALVQASLGLGIKEDIIPRYYQGVDLNSPEATPAQSSTLLEAFPTTFLASSTRDFALSQTVTTHRHLLKLGVPAELHIWEGLDHVFHYNPDLPETDELHREVVRFFDQYLK